MELKQIRSEGELAQELARGNRFLLFYSRWDPFCVEFKPAYDRIAASSPESYCIVPADALPELCVQYGVDVLPAVIFFRSGKPERRLDAVPDKGLTHEKLADFVWSCRGAR